MSERDLAIEEGLAGHGLEQGMGRRVLRLLHPVRWRIALAVVIEVALVSTILVRPWFFERVVDDALLDDGKSGIDMALVLWLGIGLTLTWVLRFILFGTNRFITGTIAIKVLGDLQRRIFEHVQGLDVSFFDRTKAGRIVSRADSDVGSLHPLLVEGPPQVLSLLLRSIGATALLFWIWPDLIIHLLFLGPPLVVVMALYKRFGTRLYARVSEATSRVTAHVVESVGGVQVIQQCVHEDVNRQRYGVHLEELRRRVVGAAVGWGFLPVLVTSVFISGLLIVLWRGYVGLNDPASDLTPGQLVRCLFYVFLFLGPLAELGNLYERLAQGVAALQRIFLLLDTPPKIIDAPHTSTMPPPAGRIDVDDLHFAYTHEPVLRGIDCHIPAGQKVAIVGPTGHGKTTFVQLLCRFYDPSAGIIRIDGCDLREVSQADLRRRIGIVLQDNVLFSGTVLANLKLAAPQADREAIERACRDLGVDEIIRHLPQGYLSEVGERGARLSLGQRQVLCLARAYLADPAVLILDEATSAIDLPTERRLQRALGRLASGRTAIIIAHRLATIRDADRILVIEAGRIVEDGTHAELVAAGGRYAELDASYRRNEEGIAG